MDALHISLFLLALATRFRASQIRGLPQHNHWTVFTTGFFHVSLALAQTHLSKTEMEDHRMQSIFTPAWIEASEPHHLCPVWALQTCITFTPQAQKDHLFILSDSFKWYSTSRTACVLKSVINLADPGKLPRAHEVHKVVAMLSFLHSHSIDEVQEVRQWRSSTSFTKRYLALHIRDPMCVAMDTISRWISSSSHSF